MQGISLLSRLCVRPSTFVFQSGEICLQNRTANAFAVFLIATPTLHSFWIGWKMESSERGLHSTNADESNPLSVIFFLGAPGSGKGTQCSLLSQYFSCCHLSAGELIRTERDTPGSQFGIEIRDAISIPGRFVPAEITCELLRRAIDDKGGTQFIIDGFPINKSNLEVWEKRMNGGVKIPSVIFLEVPEKVCVERCLKRHRGDDTEAVLVERFRSYVRETLPIVEYYRDKGLLKWIDGNQKPENVFASIREALSMSRSNL